MNINFKLWIEGIEEYTPYQGLVSRRASNRYFPFKNWFPQERIYVPFGKDIVTPEEKKFQEELADLLNDSGYELVDLRQGYARQKGKQNLYRIVKLLNKLQYEEEKKIQSQLESGAISKINYTNSIYSNNQYFNYLKNEFETMASRVKGQFLVVISNNIHDIGSMSTGRGWTSCMDLRDGVHSQDVYKEVENGGFVAYLIREEDKEIEHPISRIHIRRFDNKSGESVAIPEESVYGQEVPGFFETVKKWIDSKQGPLSPGAYCRTGGSFSDTFGEKRKMVVGPDPTNMSKIGGWLTKWLNSDKENRIKHHQYFLKAISAFFKSEEKFPIGFVKKLKSFIFDPSSTFSTGSWNQGAKQFQSAFALKYPNLISKQDFESAFDYSASKQDEMVKNLINAFPQYMSEEFFKSIKDQKTKEKIAKEKPEFTKHLHDQVHDDINRNLNVENPKFQATDTQSSYQVLGNIYDEIMKLYSMKPIPEPLIRKLVEFANNIDKLKLISDKEEMDTRLKPRAELDAEKVKNQAIESVIEAFAATGSDTPTVQKFYQSLLPKWNKIGGIGKIGWAISKLGESGRQFLPFIENKRKELEEKSNEIYTHEKRMFEEALESYDYVIDALKNGTGRSSKYRMYQGGGIEYMLSKRKLSEETPF